MFVRGGLHHLTLQALVSQLEAPSQLRRQGVAGAIRNLCFAAEVSALAWVSQMCEPILIIVLCELAMGTMLCSRPTHKTVQDGKALPQQCQPDEVLDICAVL